MISLILLAILILAVIFSFVVLLLWRNSSKRLSFIICVVIPVLVVAVIISLLVESHVRRNIDVYELTKLIDALEINERGNRLYNSEEEKLAYMDTLRQYTKKIDKIAENDSLISLMIGNNLEIKEKISQTQKVLSNQEKRYSRLNPIDTTFYIITSLERADSLISLIEPDNTTLSVLNIAFIQKKENDPASAAVLMLIKDNKTLFCRFYKPQGKLNSFMFPNLFDEGVVLRLGYLTRNGDNNIFHYVSFTPHE